VLLALADSPEADVVVVGGRPRYPNEAIVGSAAERRLRSITPDVVFPDADGLVTGRGLGAPTLGQAQLKRVMLYAARTAMVPADHSKLGTGPFPYWAPLDRPYTLVVDEQADPATVSPFRADGAVLLAPVTSAPARPAAAQAGQPGAVAG
jgi:DeoR/GlpR family transcriptional regulator of sugar metabolism